MNSYSIIIYARSIRVPIYTYFTVHVLISTFILIFCPLYNLFLMWNTHDIHARCSVILFDSCSLLKYFILNWSWPVQKMGMLISTNSFKKSTHGLRTPNEVIKQRNLKIWAYVADKICFSSTKKFGIGIEFSAVQWRLFLLRASVVREWVDGWMQSH